MYRIFTKSLISLFIPFTILSSCTKPPADVDWQTLFAVVIGKENCKGSDAEDDWLIDISVYQDNPGGYGDTVTYKGKFYAKAVKLKGLDKSLQTTGTKIVIDFRVISSDKVIATGCTVSNPTTYPLREVIILYQGDASF